MSTPRGAAKRHQTEHHASDNKGGDTLTMAFDISSQCFRPDPLRIGVSASFSAVTTVIILCPRDILLALDVVSLCLLQYPS